ncbi:MAG: Signal peptide protein-like protein [Ramlibacter sp.]|nr:Signal peptide protein-like protein [Ramlibacter sp.]
MKNFLSPMLKLGLALLLGLGAIGAMADEPAALKAKYGELRDELRSNNFHQPLHIDSTQTGDNLRGDVYAVLEHSFAEFSAAMKDPQDWCDILILPFNTKYCHAVDGNGGPKLVVRIGRKADQPIQDAFRLDFTLRPTAAAQDYFESRLEAKSGPLGTRDYRIVVSAVPIDGGRTFMHLSYSYGYGAAGRFAMQAYLSTVGADKVGFSTTGKEANGQPAYIGGVRGAIERNAMRYFLAIDAHMASLSVPVDQRLEKRIQTWFAATERYPRQLREMDRSTYLAMKRGEYERQQAMIE